MIKSKINQCNKLIIVQYTLKTADEVSKWIPSIKKEMNYYAQQTSGVRNYPDHKIVQFNKKIEELQQVRKNNQFFGLY